MASHIGPSPAPGKPVVAGNRALHGPVQTTAPKSPRLPACVSIGEAAEALAVSTKTIRRRISTGEIPAYRFGRRNLRIRVEDLESATHRVPATRHRA